MYDFLERFVELSQYEARLFANPNLRKASLMLSGPEIELVAEIIGILKPFGKWILNWESCLTPMNIVGQN